MIYPEFAKCGDLLGVGAPSKGVGDKLSDFDRSINVLKSEGYRIKETASVRNCGIVSADAKTRADEMMSLILDDSVKSILCATGGDFMMEILPHVDFDAIAKHPKWIQGYSDVTNILYPVTTLLDIATVYGCNAGGYVIYVEDGKLKYHYNYLDESYYVQEENLNRVEKVGDHFECEGIKQLETWRDCHYFTGFFDADGKFVWIMTGGRYD